MAKIDRVLAQHLQGLRNGQFAQETGLNLLQIEAAATWRLQGHGPGSVRSTPAGRPMTRRTRGSRP
ncbi:hypothetical protein ABT403_26470 [Streptomyces sp. NPDC000075]|uniref:hypothetical protein n=1 Tax=Streptomyces TaxID=1883 RepID=UPI0031D1B746